MCGIIGLVGIECGDIIIDGLKQLQNRGYDSAGISSIHKLDENPGSFVVSKYASTDSSSALNLLDTPVINEKHSGSINGIGHTRWATHGSKTDINSHPHVSMLGKISLVHNGIIENYGVLKDMLSETGNYTFHSQTDTEVIANLIESIYMDAVKMHMTYVHAIMYAIRSSVDKMEGTWGLVIQCLDCPSAIYCTRHGSPILISDNTSYAMVVSEQSGFCGRIRHYFSLHNRDICAIRFDGQTKKVIMKTNELYDDHRMTTTHCLDNLDRRDSITDSDMNMNMNTNTNMNMRMVELTPDPYMHWMIKEIHEQPDSAMRAINLGGRVTVDNMIRLGGLNGSECKNDLIDIDHIILLGCGTSYNASMLGSHYFKDVCNFSTVQIIDGAEFMPQDIPKVGKTATILFSQSGETRDLHRCIQLCHEHGIIMIGIINVVDSLIARECHCGCYLNAGREVSVASTKSFTSQVIVSSMVALWFSQNQQNHVSTCIKRKSYITDLRNLSSDIQQTITRLSTVIQTEIVPMFVEQTSCFILGKGRGEAIAHEGALKMKEISYIHAEGYSTSSLKHGPFALLKVGFPVIIFAFDDVHYAKAQNAYEEIRSRHANILFITDNIQSSVRSNNTDTKVLMIPRNNMYREVLGIIPIQLLSYYLSIEKGINPDMPRNLAKVVTVE
jgi:glutamine---fructose-6-phosphate transaminase (isomerizing)